MPTRRQKQAIPPQQKYTVRDFNEEFPSEDACLNYMMNQRFPDRVAFCVKCRSDRKHYRVAGRPSFACPKCGNHVYPLAGTIFHKSTTPLLIWFFTIRLVSSTRCGISAKQIQRETGVTYKTAWRMMKQIRIVMAESIKLKGPMEMDETYWGAPAKNKHKYKRTSEGRVVARVVPDAQAKTLLPIVAENIHKEAMVYTDDHASYQGIRWMGQDHKHKVINHSAGKYVEGYTHTNTIEGFWSLIKRGITGVYHQVGLDYLQSYLNEYTFRYNRRHVMQPMFSQLLRRTRTQVRPSAYAIRLAALQP